MFPHTPSCPTDLSPDISLEPGQVHSITCSYSDLIIATGHSGEAPLWLDFLDVTDSGLPSVIRTARITPGSGFVVRSRLTGTRRVRTRLTNVGEESTVIRLHIC